MLTLVWLILVYKVGSLLTTILMKKFLKQTFSGVIQSKDEKETETENRFGLKFELENRLIGEDTESEKELETELGPAKRFDGSDESICEELLSKQDRTRNLAALAFSGETSSHLVHFAGEGDGWTLPDDVTSVYLNQDLRRNIPEVRSKRVPVVGSFLKDGVVPWAQTEEQTHFEVDFFHPVGIQEDNLPTTVVYDENKVCHTNTTVQDGSIIRLETPKTSLEELKQREISKHESHRMDQLNVRKSVKEDNNKYAWDFGSDSDPPFAPLWEMWIGRNSRATINHRFSKHSTDKELQPSEIENRKCQVKDKLMQGTRNGSKREIIPIPDHELTGRTVQLGSNNVYEEQIQFDEGLKKDAKMFKDFIVTDEPLLEDESLSLVGSSNSSDEDTEERLEENIFNFYTPTPSTPSSNMKKLAESSNFPHYHVIPIGIPLRRSSTTIKLDKCDKEETNKFQMNNSSKHPANDKYGKKSYGRVMI